MDARSQQRPSSDEEIVVAVMGVTGAGKSTFIRLVTGNSNVHVGHSLDSATSEVECYKFSHRGVNFSLIDTPGFNDTHVTDEVITARLLTWLEKSYREGVRLNSIIYLHRIIDPKIQGSASSNIRMFKKLCGAQCFPNIVLATTFWEQVDLDIGTAREEKLKTEDAYWGRMVAKGSMVQRLGMNREDGLKVLMEITRKMGKITLQSQIEMSEGASIKDTAAAQEQARALAEHQRQLDEMLKRERREREVEMKKKEEERMEKVRRERLNILRAKEKLEREKAEEQRRLEEENFRQLEMAERERAEIQRQATILRKAQEEEAAMLERMRREAEERQRERQRRLNEERQAYYRNYICLRSSRTFDSMWCSRCFKSLENSWYYHCCHCQSDDYDHCASCGDRCPVNEHPTMNFLLFRKPPSDDCVIQ